MPTSGDPSADPAGLRLEHASQNAPSPPRSSKRWVIWLIAMALALAGLAAYLLADRAPQTQKPAAMAAVPTVAVRVGTFDRTIMVAGQTSARNFAVVSVPVLRGQGGWSGLSLTKLVAGGIRVKAGDIVAEIDPQTYIEQLDDLDDSIAQAEADLRKKKAQQTFDWESLQQDLRSNRAEADRATLDYKAAEVKTPIEQELLRLSMDEALAAYKQSLASEGFHQTSFQADLRAQEISFAQRLKRRERLANDIKHFTFRAPMDGLAVVQSFVRSGGDMAQYQAGDSVAPGQSFLKIVDTASMQLEARANQTESSEIRVGQPAAVTLDAFPGLRFQGRVYSLGAMAVPSRRDSYYLRAVPVTVQVQGEDSRLIPDLSGAAEILVGRKENALIIPVEAVHSEGNRDFVFVSTRAGFEKRQVEIGLSSTTEAAVVSGLAAGDKVALTTPQAPQK
jgi:HlyD family secretion protein